MACESVPKMAGAGNRVSALGDSCGQALYSASWSSAARGDGLKEHPPRAYRTGQAGSGRPLRGWRLRLRGH